DLLELLGHELVFASPEALPHGPLQQLELAADVRGYPLPSDLLVTEPLPLGGARRDDVIPWYDGCEERLEPVVVLSKDRVELVIMTSGAAEAQAKEHLGGDVRHVVEDDFTNLADLTLIALVDPMAEGAGNGQRVRVFWSNLVTGELFPDEPVVRLIVIERTDDVIAVAPGLGSIVIAPMSVRLRVSHEVQPVSTPAFAMARTCQQTADQDLVRRRGAV